MLEHQRVERADHHVQRPAELSASEVRVPPGELHLNDEPIVGRRDVYDPDPGPKQRRVEIHHPQRHLELLHGYSMAHLIRCETAARGPRGGYDVREVPNLARAADVPLLLHAEAAAPLATPTAPNQRRGKAWMRLRVVLGAGGSRSYCGVGPIFGSSWRA